MNNAGTYLTWDLQRASWVKLSVRPLIQTTQGPEIRTCPFASPLFEFGSLVTS